MSIYHHNFDRVLSRRLNAAQLGGAWFNDAGDFVKGAKSIAKKTKIVSTLGKAILPGAVSAISAINPLAGMAAGIAGKELLKSAEKSGYGRGGCKMIGSGKKKPTKSKKPKKSKKSKK
jgi:hypothetical protein